MLFLEGKELEDDVLKEDEEDMLDETAWKVHALDQAKGVATVFMPWQGHTPEESGLHQFPIKQLRPADLLSPSEAIADRKARIVMKNNLREQLLAK